MEKATIIKKISAVETLLNIPEGETRTIDRTVIRFSSIRTAIYNLKKKGYNFKASEAGSVTEIVITRLKNSRNEKSSN